MRCGRTILDRLRRDGSGLTTVEFALVAPVMILVLLTTYDLGNATWRSMRLEMAARNGAQYAFANPTDAAGIVNAVQNAVAGWANVTILTPVMACKCDDGSGADCTTGSCTVGGIVYAPIGYISVTASQSFTFTSPLTAALFPRMTTLTGNVQLRLH